MPNTTWTSLNRLMLSHRQLKEVICVIAVTVGIFICGALFSDQETLSGNSVRTYPVLHLGDDTMFVPGCHCSKFIVPSNTSAKQPPLKYTTCSKETWTRGRNQKVIAFTYYEPLTEVKEKQGREYFAGITENLRLIERFYPGWLMRVYYEIDSDEVMRDLCYLACREPSLDICDAKNNPRLGNMTMLYPLVWRFLPAIDHQVDLFMSRDLDSRITPREVAAVFEFLSTNRSIHVMRDHPAHSALILGGTWAAKLNDVRKNFTASFKQLFKDGLAYVPRENGGYDQVALIRFFWPWMKNFVIAHDSYTCRRFSRTVPFPTRREEGIGNFVGSVVSLNASIPFTERNHCPKKCRPPNHQDWIFC